MANTNKNGDPLTKGLGVAIALGALAAGAAAAFMNNERTRQMREDLQRQITDLSSRMDRELAARRPEIEDAIQRGRQVAVEGLERFKGVVEQSADRAQEYVQRASVKTSDAAVDLRDQASGATNQAANGAEDTIHSITTRADDALSGAAPEGVENMSNTGEQANTGASDADLSDPARQAVAESGDAFSGTIDTAAATIGSATVESAQGLGGGGESISDESPGMADYNADSSLGADMTIEKPGQEGGNT